VQAACLTGVVSTALKSLSRLRHLSRWRSMVMQSFSPKRRRSSSARKFTVVRLATCTADDMRGVTGEQECAADGTDAPLRRFGCHTL
jgi:hypothetical protein